MTDEIGRVLGGRYRLRAPLGAGASAQVYLADDERLRRRVAVKVLHASLADDEAFLRRFRAEAQAAAALNHPHIVAVYDWNGDEGTPFLVTECLSGGSLRSMLDAGHRLTPSQALVVGLEAARALDHAHSQGFVHRDIKPANLVFGEDGRLRIADFGLARAIAEAHWTEPQGAVLGTARYASPEQARGELVEGHSDVYSLALVLIEGVSGVVPFSADTTIGTLMARLDRPIEAPDDLGPLRPVVEAAGHLHSATRLDAAGLGEALVAAAEQLPRPAPLPLGTGVPVDAVDDGDAQPPAPADAATDDGDRTVTGTAATGSVLVAAPPVEDLDRTDVVQLPPGALDDRGGDLPPPGASGSDLPPARRGPSRWLITVLAVMAAVAIGAGGAVLVQRSSVPSHTVPSGLVGRQYRELNDYVGEYGWRIDVQEERADGTEAGEILATDPASGEDLREGETLVVVRSQGPTLVEVPADLVGMPRDQAEERLAAEGTELVAEVEEQPSEDVEEGDVISVGEGPARVPKGSTITLVVSTGPESRQVPDVVGDPFADARAALEDMDLGVEREDANDDEGGEPGTVVATDPGPGSEVERGASVTLVVVPETRTMPDLSGMRLSRARDRLEDADLEQGAVIGRRGGRVLGTLPVAGDEVEQGTSVQIFMR